VVPGPVALALVVAARFGLLLGMALWLGLVVGALLIVPVLFKRLARPQAHDVIGAVLHRVDRLLLGAMALVLLALGSRMVLDRAAPPGSLALPVACMVASRLIGALVMGPAGRALHARLQDANAPASDAERGAFDRLHAASLILLTLEACLGLYALFAVS
jgi:hypothetical protein